MTQSFTRAQDRPSNTKAFSFNDDQLGGRSVTETYKSYPEFDQSSQMQKVCDLYAAAYSETMITRLL